MPPHPDMHYICALANGIYNGYYFPQSEMVIFSLHLKNVLKKVTQEILDLVICGSCIWWWTDKQANMKNG